ncbi:MAG: sugar porter family MFS transporter [Verrucomicrobiota bacterium]
MHSRLFFWSLTSALSGFLFGFDMVVISGAEQAIQKLWDLSAGQHGWLMSSALWGTVVGGLLGSWPADRFGRRKTLLAIGIAYFISALGSAIAPDPVTLMMARFLGGIGIGVSTVAAPLFIAELSPASQRGRLAGLYQFNIVFAILVAFASNALIRILFTGLGEEAWRVMLGVEALPALLYTLLCLRLPESPRWLVLSRGDREGAREVLRQVNPDQSEEELEERIAEIAHSAGESKGRERLFRATLLKPLLLVFALSAFNQLSGINAVLFYAPRIFEMGGFEGNAALLNSIGIGVTNLVFTFLGLWLIDRVGRRMLILMGGVGYVVTLSLIAWCFASETFALMPYFVFAFIAAHAIGQGTVIWVYISEIFPAKQRAAGTSFGVSVHWIFAAVIAQVFPTLIGGVETEWVFGAFAGLMALAFFWALFFMVESKGRSLEEMEEALGIKTS